MRPQIQGDTLIDRVKVGLYNLTEREIHRTETPPTTRNFKDSNNSVLGTDNKNGRGSKKENSIQQFREANSLLVNNQKQN